MLYTSGWKSGFFTGLITGVVISAMAKSPRGKNILDTATSVLKREVNNLSQQATDVIDGTVKVANDLSGKAANSVADTTVTTPGGSYSAANV